MNFRTTLFLLVLVVAVGTTIYFTRGKDDKAKTPDKTEAHKLLDIASDDVTRVSITDSDGNHLVLKKTGSDWTLQEPVAARAKTFETGDLVRALVDLQSRGQLDESKKTAGGLDHPNFIVELTSNSDKVTKLSFGDSSPVGDSLYVLVDDNAKPEIVGNAIYATLGKPASTYRDMKLVTTPSSDIRQLQIADKGKTIKLEKTGETWKMVEPVDTAADFSAVTDFLSSLTTLDATAFLENPPTSATNTLAHPRLTISFSTQAPSTQPASDAEMRSVKFGGYQDITRKNLFVSLDGKEVAIVAASSEKSFEKSPLDFRNKDVANIDPERVKRFTVSINRPATTQPTTRPAEVRELTIERKQAAPAGPATLPATQPAVATTQPALPTTQPAVATTGSARLPTNVAGPELIDDTKWVFTSGGAGPAEQGQVEALLGSFHPLHAEKYIEPVKETGNTYTLTIHAVPAKAADAAEDYVFTFIETPTRVIGTYRDLQFEVNRELIDKLTGDFKTKKVAPPTQPPPSFGGGASPLGGGQ